MPSIPIISSYFGSNAGKTLLHHLLNDLIWRACARAVITATKEPQGLITPMVQLLHHGVKVEVLDWTSQSQTRLPTLMRPGLRIMETGATEAKHVELSQFYCFFPVALEMLDPINSSGQASLPELGKRLSFVTSVTTEKLYLRKDITWNPTF